MPLPLLTLHEKKKAQLQVGETIFVLIILLFLGMLVFNFYFQSATADLQLHQSNVEEFNVLETAQLASNLDELKCPEQEGICFDIHKAIAMSEIKLDDTDYYQELFLNAKITLKEIYPYRRDIIIYWDNASNNNQTNLPALLPVMIYNGTADRHSFGILQVERYYR